jgi:hypothetical protein
MVAGVFSFGALWARSVLGMIFKTRPCMIVFKSGGQKLVRGITSHPALVSKYPTMIYLQHLRWARTQLPDYYGEKIYSLRL